MTQHSLRNYADYSTDFSIIQIYPHLTPPWLRTQLHVGGQLQTLRSEWTKCWAVLGKTTWLSSFFKVLAFWPWIEWNCLVFAPINAKNIFRKYENTLNCSVYCTTSEHGHRKDFPGEGPTVNFTGGFQKHFCRGLTVLKFHFANSKLREKTLFSKKVKRLISNSTGAKHPYFAPRPTPVRSSWMPQNSVYQQQKIDFIKGAEPH